MFLDSIISWLKVALETLPKIDAISQERKRDKLGRDFLALYIRLNLIVENGYEILRKLEYIAADRLKQGAKASMAHETVLIHRQIKRLDEVLWFLDVCKHELSLFQPRFKEEVSNFVVGKGTFLTCAGGGEMAEFTFPTGLRISKSEPLTDDVRLKEAIDHERNQLLQMEETLQRFRESLLKIFTLEELLLEVRDPRFRTAVEGIWGTF